MTPIADARIDDALPAENDDPRERPHHHAGQQRGRMTSIRIACAQRGTRT
jgi:hypothetical protein